MGYVERQAYAAAALVARMEEGALDKAPVWDDLATFDGEPWCGKVAGVLAGFPCQPVSVAGQRRGQSDQRWLWPEIERILWEVRPAWVLLENVRGLATVNGGAAFQEVLASLALLGFDAEWGMLAAPTVGAPHRKRERVFIVGKQYLSHSDGAGAGNGGAEAVQNSDRAHDRVLRANCGDAEPTVAADPSALAYSYGLRAGEPDDAQRPFSREDTRDTPGGGGGATAVAYPYDYGGGSDLAQWSETVRAFAWPPGPGDRALWQRVISTDPWLAPAIHYGGAREVEPILRGLVDGLAPNVVASRADGLRLLGNGVVPLQAAAAFMALVQRLTGERRQP